MSKRVVILGAGFSGLALSALLAREGYSVTVLEKNSVPGGRAMVFNDGPFVFDMGPSWYLMPEVFERFFAVFGKRPSDYYELVRLDPSYRCWFGANDRCDVPAGLGEIRELFEELEPGAAAALDRYLDRSAYQYRVALDEFIYKEYRSVFDFFTLRLLREAPKLHLFQMLDGYVKRFFRNPRIHRILEYNTVFLGSDPVSTPALYSLMTHVDFNLGVWYPLGGMGSVVNGMYSLCRELGVEFHFDSPAERISTRGGVARSVRANGADFEADLVVSSADYHHTETELLAPEDRSYSERWWKNRTLAPSALLAYLGVSGKVDGLRHHSLYLDMDWDRHFDTIFRRPAWPSNPSYYVCCPSKTDPSVAPPDDENLFLLVPLASRLDDRDEVREQLFDSTMRHLEEMTGDRIVSRIVSKRLFSHRDFRETFNAFGGTALGLAHTLFQTAIFRPRHRSRRVRNLYYTGNFTHPGIGVPMVLISSHIVAGEIIRDRR